MNSNMIRYLTFIVLIFFVNDIQAQAKKSSDTATFSIQADYLSNYIYNGRVDSIKYPYQTTTVSLHLANGIFSNFSASYLLTPGMKGFDFYQLDLGYEYTIGKKIYGELYGVKYFYSGESNLINGNITTDFGISLNYDFTFFQFNNNFDVFFTNKSDIQYTPGIEKTIYLGIDKNSNWNVNPYLYCNFSSVNYYESNVIRNLNRLKRPPGKNVILPQIARKTEVQNKGFKLLSTDFSIPLTYEDTHWLFTLTPTYSIPFNKIETITTNTITSATGTVITKINSTPYSDLYLNNQFYFQIGVAYKF